MKSLRASPARSQRGSIYTTMILVVLFAMVILAALKVVPAYIDDSTITGTMQTLADGDEFETMSLAQVQTNLMRTLNTNRIDFDAKNIVLTKDGAKEYIDINYESRKPLFYNIEAVVVFSHRFEKK